jgi:hypothetical protein
MSEPQEQARAITRRDALKKGAVVGGLVWTVPVVQAIGVTPANAAVPSGTNSPKPPQPTKPPKPRG